MGKLTKTAIDALAIPAKGQAFLWDSELRGFGVRVIPSGLKAFVLQYRNDEGRSRRIVIGRYGVLTVEQARKQAILKLAAVVGGADPAEERAQSRAAITIREVCNWYLENAEAGMILGRKHRPIKASTLAMDRSRIETHIVPLIGTRQVRALRIADIEDADGHRCWKDGQAPEGRWARWKGRRWSWRCRTRCLDAAKPTVACTSV